jgi:hypothetical protein
MTRSVASLSKAGAGVSVSDAARVVGRLVPLRLLALANLAPVPRYHFAYKANVSAWAREARAHFPAQVGARLRANGGVRHTLRPRQLGGIARQGDPREASATDSIEPRARTRDPARWSASARVALQAPTVRAKSTIPACNARKVCVALASARTDFHAQGRMSLVSSPHERIELRRHPGGKVTLAWHERVARNESPRTRRACHVFVRVMRSGPLASSQSNPGRFAEVEP